MTTLHTLTSLQRRSGDVLQIPPFIEKELEERGRRQEVHEPFLWPLSD